MLSSTITRQSTLRPRLATHQTILNAQAVPLAAARLDYHARGFRFGIWAAHVNPALRHELRRQQQLVKQRCVDALARHMSLDQGRLQLDARSAFKRMTSGCFESGKARWSWHFASQDEPTARRTYASAQSWQFDNQPSGPRGRRQPSEGSSSVNSATQTRTYTDTKKPDESSSADHDYIIDPITNRRVLKSTYGSYESAAESAVNTTNTTFGAEPSLFPTFEAAQPHHSSGPPPADELDKYGNVTIDSAEPSDFADSAPVLFTFDSTSEDKYAFTPSSSEEYSLNHLAPEEADFPMQEGELDKYKRAVVDEIQDAEESKHDYDDLSEYKPVFNNENAEVKSDPAYEDLDDYQPFLHNENLEAKSDPAYSDLGGYQPYLHNEGTEPAKTLDYKDLDSYQPYLHNEASQKESNSPAYDDLGKYGPYEHNENMATQSQDPEHGDLDQYNPYMHQEREREAAEKLGEPVPEDLSQYKPKIFNDFPDVAAPDEPFQQYGDLDKYMAFRDEALEGEATAPKDDVADSLDEYDSKQEEHVVAAGDGVDFTQKMGNLGVEQTEPVCVFDSTAHGVPAELPKRSAVVLQDPAHPHQSSRVPANIADRDNRALDQVPTKPASDAICTPVCTPALTGNYIRDFPEQFAQTWNIPTATADFTLPAEEQAFAEQLRAASTMPIYASSQDRAPSKPKLESALNRRSNRRASKIQPQKRPRLRADYDSYSSEPQGLETSYIEECRDQPKGPSFVRTYGTQRPRDDRVSKQVAEPPASRAGDGLSYHRDPEVDGQGYVDPSLAPATPKPTEPTIYRVLAYDSATQNVSIAETTSDVHDQSSPSAPADILLRLTHPSKFFPYFAPLQAEGFEIVSGDGDVLVFRKVRAEMRRANPIDLMGNPVALPNAAAFASPTGFVNYDVPSADEAESNASATQDIAGAATQSAPTRKKMGLGKKVLFAGTSALGVTYATGVVAEYFGRPNPRPGRF